MKPPLILIGGIDPTGRAGLGRDLDTCAHFGIHGCPVPSAWTVQDDNEVRSIQPTPPTDLARMFEAAIQQSGATWAKVGSLFSAEQAAAVAHVAERDKIRLVVDPVLGSSSGKSFLSVEAWHILLEHAFLATPNEEEAKALGPLPCRTLVTGGGVRPDRLGQTAYAAVHIEGTHRGTGCRLATAIACELAAGLQLEDAIPSALSWLQRELSWDAKNANLDGPRRRHLRETRRALALVLRELRYEHIPEVGINLAYALPGARGPEDVAGLAGRITIAGFDRGWTGRVMYGGPHHTGRIAVVLQEYDEDARLVMNHRYDRRFIEQARDAGLTAGTFRRADEPAEAPSSMEWGVRRAIEDDGAVPDLIWDTGGPGKEAMIRVIGRDGDDVRRKLRCLHGDEGPPEASSPRDAPRRA